MSLCPKCGQYMCDHSLEERGQTREELFRPLCEEELDAWNLPLGNPRKIEVAKKHAHDPV